MKVYGIVAEYNPFHNGHKHQIETIRQQGATHIVAIMSSSFVQRGEVACLDKWTRTKSALLNGVDLVIELDVVSSLCSAEGFSDAAIYLMNALGCIDYINFGSECGDVELIKNVANAVIEIENGNELKAQLSKGIVFPKARENAIRERFGDEISNILKTPNNILGVEYVKALIKSNSSIIPTTIPRFGTNHDSNVKSKSVASASEIRKMIGTSEISDFVPTSSKQLYENAINSGLYANQKNIEPIILYKLRTMTKQQIKQLAEVSEGLENRIFEAIKQATSLEQLYELIKSKRYTLARIRRIINYALLDITKDEKAKMPQYIRVLGMTKAGIEILKLSKKTAKLDIITEFSDTNKFDFSKAEIEKRATDIFYLATQQKQKCSMDFYNSAIVIE